MDRTRMPWEPDSDGASGVPEDGSTNAGCGYAADKDRNAEHHLCRYAVGETIFSGPGTECRGTVTKVSTVVGRLISVVWSDGDGEIIYPMDAPYLRKALPWE